MAYVGEFTEHIRRKIHKKLVEFAETMERFETLQVKIHSLIEEAVSNGQINLRTPRDVQVLVDAYTKLAEAEIRLAEILNRILQSLNERDAIVSALIVSNQIPRPELPENLEAKVLVPIIERKAEFQQPEESITSFDETG